MKKYFIYLIFFMFPVINKADFNTSYPAGSGNSDLYTILHLSDYGLSKEIFQLALKGYTKLETTGKLANPDILTIIDFSQSSRNKRMYIIDLINNKILFNTLVAHGRNTGEEFAQHFSNDLGSLKSSLGFYVTKNEAVGAKVGLSLVIRGVEKGFNDNAENRQIIMHGAPYVTEEFISKTGRLGRSYGCPALPPYQIRPVIETIEKGSCLFIYNPDPVYLRNSVLLN